MGMQPWEVQLEIGKEHAATIDRIQLLESRLYELVAAGDALAHEMSYADHRAPLERWWQARGGHDKCTVCNGKLPP